MPAHTVHRAGVAKDFNWDNECILIVIVINHTVEHMHLSIRSTRGKKWVCLRVFVVLNRVHHTFVGLHALVWFVGEVAVIPLCVVSGVAHEEVVAIWVNGKAGRETSMSLVLLLELVRHEIVAAN